MHEWLCCHVAWLWSRDMGVACLARGGFIICSLLFVTSWTSPITSDFSLFFVIFYCWVSNWWNFGNIFPDILYRKWTEYFLSLVFHWTGKDAPPPLVIQENSVGWYIYKFFFFFSRTVDDGLFLLPSSAAVFEQIYCCILTLNIDIWERKMHRENESI